MYEEEDARAPVNYYGHTKMTAEDDLMQYKGLWSIVRTVLVYGKPFLSRHNIITNVAQGLHEGKTLKIFSDQSRTPTYVEDLVLGILAIIEKRAAGIYHLSGKDVLSPYEIAVAVAQHLHCNQDLIQSVTESEFSQPARRPPKTGFNLTKARSELSYEPVSFQEGLAKTLKLD
jgi:dTDP-4-dehydrorhamnose reductase